LPLIRIVDNDSDRQTLGSLADALVLQRTIEMTRPNRRLSHLPFGLAWSGAAPPTKREVVGKPARDRYRRTSWCCTPPGRLELPLATVSRRVRQLAVLSMRVCDGAASSLPEFGELDIDEGAGTPYATLTGP
jgi:hypothetical protein